jgi:hypothetical protein
MGIGGKCKITGFFQESLTFFGKNAMFLYRIYGAPAGSNYSIFKECFFMKKGIVTVVVLLLACFALSCGSAPAAAPAGGNPNLPSFMLNPPSDEDGVYGTGSAKMQNTNMSREAADSRARADIAFKLSTQVKGMITDYSRQAGTENSPAAIGFYESVNQQLTNTTLKGVEVVKREQTPDGTIHTLARISKADAAKAAADLMSGVIENEASRYAEFKAMDALRMMEEQLKK